MNLNCNKGNSNPTAYSCTFVQITIKKHMSTTSLFFDNPTLQDRKKNYSWIFLANCPFLSISGYFWQTVYKDATIFDREYSCKVMPTSKRTKITKSIFITDTRNEGDLGKLTYVYEFDKSMVPDRAWKALMVLEEKGKFHYPNFGDSGYHALVDNVKDHKFEDEDLQEFFNLAMEEEHDWPRKGSTREQNMKQVANCSWVVHLVEE